MRLYILGKNTDDKGAQLEQLTKTILERQGYSNIVTNLQVAGGGEIDVTAKYVHQTGIRNNVQLVICECKAHEKPIDMNDWQKFIGKLLIARKTNQNAIGLMIALTGANGSVEGSKEKDFAGDNSVQLIANDDLIELLSQIYALPTRWSLKDTIISLIQRNDLYFDLNLLYYEYSLFWIAEVKGKFILLTKDGKLLSEQESKNILELLPNFTPYNPTQYWDILAERETERQLYEINRLVTEMILIMKKVEKSTLFLQ